MICIWVTTIYDFIHNLNEEKFRDFFLFHACTTSDNEKLLQKKIDLETLFSVLCVDVAFGFAHFYWHFYSKTSQEYYNYLPLKTLGKIYFTKRQFPCFVRQAQLNYLFNGSFFVHILNDNNIFPRIFFSRKI